MIKIPILESERLRLERPTTENKKEIFFLRSDGEVNKFVKRPQPEKMQDAVDFINKINGSIDAGEVFYWGIFLKNQETLIGTISLWHFSEDRKTAEVGYDLMPDYHRKGIMNEAINFVINFGKYDLNLDMIEAFTHGGNTASTKLLSKNGFVLNPERKDDDNEDNAIFEKRISRT